MEDITYTYSNKLKYKVNPSEIKSLIIPGKFTSMKQVDLKDYINLEELIFTGLTIDLNEFNATNFPKLKKVDLSKCILKNTLDEIVFSEWLSETHSDLEEIILPNNKNLIIGSKIYFLGFFKPVICSKKLKNIVFPSSINKLRTNAIMECDSLSKLEINANVIFERSIYSCSSLKELIIGKNVKKCGYLDFPNLEKLVINNPFIKKIGNSNYIFYSHRNIDVNIIDSNNYELMPLIDNKNFLLEYLCNKIKKINYINNPNNLYKTKLIEFSKIRNIKLESINLPTDIKHYDILKQGNEYNNLKILNIKLIFNNITINTKELQDYFIKIDPTKKMHILSYFNYEDALKEIDYINNISNVSSIIFIGKYLLFNERESIINKIKSKNKDMEVFFKMSEEKEIKEENTDSEISDLLESIKRITNLLPSNIKDMTDNVLKEYFDTYLINLKKEQINNNPEIGKKRVFGEILEMGSARKNLLLKLNNMLFELNNIKGYCEKVSYYEELINDNNLSNEIFSSIKSIYELFDLNTKKIIIEEIKNIINEERIVYINLISNSFKNPANKLNLENSIPTDKLLMNLSNYEDKLKNYYKNNKKTFRLLKVMDSEDITLNEINGINYKIRLIELTIQEMYFGNKGILLNKFYEIIDKYKNILLNNISNYSTNSNYEDIVILLNEELNNFYENNKDKITSDYKLNNFSNELDNCDRIVKNDKELAICSNNSLIESYMCDIQNLYIKSDKNINIGNLIDSIDNRLYVESCILNSYLSNMEKDYDIDKHYNDLLSFIIDKYYNILDYLNQVDIFKKNYQEDKKYIKTINNYK